jgi:hypothetical protein
MTPDKTIARLRTTNPVVTQTDIDARLFESIVASPGDPRLSAKRQRMPARGALKIAVLAAALTVGVGAAWAATSGALELFRSNPQNEGAAPASLWDQDVVPATLVRAATLDIPRYGRVEFWYANAAQGGWCGAIQLPNRRWAATKESGTSGAAPGCYPTREQTNGDDPIFVINGFDYYEVQIDARDAGGSFWRIYYGVIEADKPVAEVIDRLTGRGAVVHGGERFALAVPDPQPDRAVPLPNAYAIDLVAYAADGAVIAAEHP